MSIAQQRPLAEKSQLLAALLDVDESVSLVGRRAYALFTIV
jgi:hypothetical protein